MFTATRCGRSQRRWMPTYKTCRRPCPTCTKTAWSARRSWAAPTSLASATVSAYAGITQFVNDLIAAHPAVVDRINQSANAYNDAESSNTAAAQGAGQGSGCSGSAPQGGYGGPAPLSQGGGTGAISGSGGGRGSLAGFSPAPSGGLGLPGGAGLGGSYPLSGDGKTWHIKVDGFYAGGTGGMTAEQVNALVEPIQPDGVTSAAAAFQRASQKLAQQAVSLLGHPQRLAGAWGGATAPKALAQIRQLHDTALSLANASQGVGSVLQWQDTTIMPYYKQQIKQLAEAKSHENIFDKAKDFLAGGDSRDQAAANQLAKFNTRIAEAYNSLPSTVQKNLPPSS